MINGEMSEAQRGYAVLEETEQNTFDRFVQWMYKGFYEPGEPFDRPPAKSSQGKKAITVENFISSDLERLTSRVDDKSEVGVFSAKKRLKKAKYEIESQIEIPKSKFTSRDELKVTFLRRKPVARRTCIDIRPQRPNEKSNEDYSEVFLSHAQLYVFAEKYDIQDLKMLALDNLHDVLTVYTLYEERTGDIITLLRYVSENTGEPVEGNEDLRTLLGLYVGFEMDMLMKDEGFRNVMIDDGGALLGDFIKMVRKRISLDLVE